MKDLWRLHIEAEDFHMFWTWHYLLNRKELVCPCDRLYTWLGIKMYFIEENCCLTTKSINLNQIAKQKYHGQFSKNGCIICICIHYRFKMKMEVISQVSFSYMLRDIYVGTPDMAFVPSELAPWNTTHWRWPVRKDGYCRFYEVSDENIIWNCIVFNGYEVDSCWLDRRPRAATHSVVASQRSVADFQA